VIQVNEFSLINDYFNSIAPHRDDVLFGIGDDAACVRVPADMDLLVSTDTLVENVHFRSDWDAYDIAWRSVNVNVSDMAAMAALPCWVSLALTLPTFDESWLRRFSLGLSDALRDYNIALIGGDTTRGPLTITLTIHGLAPKGQAIRRSGANVGDAIVVSGALGAAAQAVVDEPMVDAHLRSILMDKLLRPRPRLDLMDLLRSHATAAIDISDGLSADLNHILNASQVGATLDLASIPVHPFVQQIQKANAIEFALSGGDDYELCFTVPLKALHYFTDAGLGCCCVGMIESDPGLRAKTSTGDIVPLTVKGYSHF